MAVLWERHKLTSQVQAKGNKFLVNANKESHPKETQIMSKVTVYWHYI